MGGGREGDAGRQLGQWESSDAGPSIPHVPLSQSETGDAEAKHPTHVCRAANEARDGECLTQGMRNHHIWEISELLKHIFCPGIEAKMISPA